MHLNDVKRPVIQRFEAVGKAPYDALITPDGRYYIAGLFGDDGCQRAQCRGGRMVLGNIAEEDGGLVGALQRLGHGLFGHLEGDFIQIAVDLLTVDFDCDVDPKMGGNRQQFVGIFDFVITGFFVGHRQKDFGDIAPVIGVGCCAGRLAHLDVLRFHAERAVAQVCRRNAKAHKQALDVFR